MYTHTWNDFMQKIGIEKECFFSCFVLFNLLFTYDVCICVCVWKTRENEMVETFQ